MDDLILNLRGGGTLDLRAFKSISPRLDDGEYFIREIIKQINAGLYDDQPIGGTVLDLGANCGLFAAHVAGSCERVISVEPSPRHYPVLCEFLEEAGLTNARPIHAAIWGHDGEVPFEFYPGNATSDHVSTDGEKVPCLSVATLMDRHGINYADFVKMDIEGSEEAAIRSFSFPDAARRIGTLWCECHGYPENIRQVMNRVDLHLRASFLDVSRLGKEETGEAVVLAREPRESSILI